MALSFHPLSDRDAVPSPLLRRNSLVWIALALTLTVFFGCGHNDSHDVRRVSASTLLLELPASLGEARRPAVEFDHAAHTQALSSDGCKICHAVDSSGSLKLELIPKEKSGSAGELMDAYHEKCMGCHRQRVGQNKKAGGLSCADCHRQRSGASASRVPLRFDYGLHHRHAKQPDLPCETCHHVYDPEKKQLRYEEGAEEGCRSCHLKQADGTKPSLRDAVHQSCVNCHLRRAGEQRNTGPVLCHGCHDPTAQSDIERPKAPRMERKQPDWVWILAQGATAHMVGFDHQAHEEHTQFCTDCHHNSLGACKECHTLTGHPDGKGVTLEDAYHLGSSTHSCVGCHAKTAAEGECSGCHDTVSPRPGENSCGRCHRGKPGGPTDLPPDREPVELAPLPAISEAFPETVTIEGIAREYGPSTLPHAKIVARLDRASRENPLAARFHGRVETLCAACHHHSPMGERPPRCVSCHPPTAQEAHGRPGLKAAYHVQCIGCHQRMRIEALKCTDCHEKAPGEVKR